MKTIDVRKGPIGPTLVRLSLPILAGQAFNLLYNLVDTYFVALIDPSDPWLVGATGIVFPLFFIFMALSFGISGGVSSLVARAIGAGRAQDLDKTAESGFFLAIVASAAVLALVYPFADPLLRLFGGNGQLLEYGREYLLWLLPTLPFMLLSAVFIGILQGEGRTKHMMVSMVIGTVMNLILDPLLIFTAGMGIAGAALATAIANAIGFLYLLAVFIRTQSQVRIHWKLSSISARSAGEILRVGLPQSVMSFLNSIAFIFYNRTMMDINPFIMSAFTLYSRMEQMAIMPVWALSSGLAAISGQAAGAKEIERMRASSRTGSAIGLSVSGTLLLAFVLASPWLFRVFQSNSEVLSLAGRIAPWMAASTFLAIPVFMVNTVMSSSGFAGRSLALTAIRIYALNVPACMLGAYVIGKGLVPSLAGLFLSSLAALAITLAAQERFFSGLKSGRISIRGSTGQAEA
jgi:putative MATE family efflux protein